MQNRKILIASIINLIATFLPYGLMDLNYNYFLWKYNRSSELVVDWFRIAVDTVNMINAITIFASSIMLLVLSLIQLKKENQKIEQLISFAAIVSICANLFFCYHIYQLGEYRFINIGVLIAMASCTYIVANKCDFDKKSLLIIGATLVVAFPSIIQMYRETIEAPIEAHYLSFQTYFFLFYSMLDFNEPAWLLAVPAMIAMFFTFRCIILILTNNKKKMKAVNTMCVWYKWLFVLEILFAIISTEDTYITLTYPVAITLVSIYLHLEKKGNNKEVTI